MENFLIRAQADNLQDAQKELCLEDSSSIITIIDSERVSYGVFKNLPDEEYPKIDSYSCELRRSQLPRIQESLALFKKKYPESEAVVIVQHTALSIASFLLYCEGNEEAKEEIVRVYLKPYIDWFYQHLSRE